MPRDRKPSVDLKLNTPRVVKALSDTAATRMYEATQRVRNQVLEKLAGDDRTGREYKVPGTQRTYTASAPEEPPAVQTGRLRQDIKTKVEAEGREVVGYVGSTLDYSLWLEFGTSRMAQRPFLRPSFDEALPDVKNILSRRWWD